MTAAYIDTSALVAVALQQEGWQRVTPHLAAHGKLHASELLLAELLSVAMREDVVPNVLLAPFEAITVIIPNRSIVPELNTVAAGGYLRGADLWHLACALYLSPNPKELFFLTCDGKQRAVAKRLGFRVAA